MRIRGRLVTGFSITIIAMCFITGFALHQMYRIKDRVDSIVDVSSRKVTLALKLKTDILSVTVLEKNILLARELSEAKSLIETAQDQSLKVSEHISSLKDLVEEDQTDSLTQLAKIWSDYIDVTKQVNDLATQETLKQANQLSQGEALEAFDSVMDELASMLENNRSDMNKSRDNPKRYEQLIAQKTLVMGIENQLFGIQEAEQSLLSAKSEENINQFIGSIENSEISISEHLKQLKGLPGNYNWLAESMQTYLKHSLEIRRLVGLNPKLKAQRLLNNEGENHLKRVNLLLDKLISRNEQAMVDDQRKSGNALRNTIFSGMGFLVTAVLFCAAVSYFLSRSITSPLIKLNRVTRALADGDTSVRSEIEAKHEVGELSNAFNHMAEIIHQRVELQTGLNKLATSMRGDQTPNELAQNVVNCLADILNFQLGALYFTEENKLKLIASFAFKYRSAEQNELQMGEGLVGQAALERKSIIFSDIPESHIDYRIHSGLGTSPVKNILIQPLLQNDNLIGVLVFGSIHDIEEQTSEFIDQANENIAIALEAAKTRAAQSGLLEATQRQAQQLREQQDSLSNANQQLEKQTQDLQLSQEKLETRGAELEQLNEALESKTALLHEQKVELEKSKDLLEAKAEELDRASRYKSEFLANMSHELRSPLNSMLLLSKTLSKNDENNLTREQVDSLNYIHSGGQELLSHINDILDLSKVEAGKLDFYFETVDAVQLCQDLELAYRPQIQEKGIGFELEIQQQVPRFIHSDKKRIIQILRNLISNAIKFTHEGKIVLGLFQPENKVSLKNKSLEQNNPICLSVKDTGIGIPEDKCQAIFEAFQQADGSTSRKYGGTGLGLAISREFSKRLCGEIQVRSESGKGSEFILILPESADETAVEIPEGAKAIFEGELPNTGHSQTAVGSDTSFRPEDKKVARQIRMRPQPKNFDTAITDDRDSIKDGDRTLLIIEDDIGFSKILIDYAHTKGFKCIAAGSGQSGIELAQQYRPLAITLDLGLPDLKGTEVLEALQTHEDTKDIPIHIISSYDDSPEVASKINEYLTKPVTDEDLDDLFDMVDKETGEAIESANIGNQTPTGSATKHLFAPADTQQPSANDPTPPVTDNAERQNPHRGKRVLLVDDDIRNMFALTQILRNEGMLVVKADNGELAVNRVKESLEKNEQIDVILMDIMMPVMDGYEAMKQIRSLGEQCKMPIIALTAKAMAGDKEKCIEAGADDYLTKPLDELKLLSLLDKWLTKQQIA